MQAALVAEFLLTYSRAGWVSDLGTPVSHAWWGRVMRCAAHTAKSVLSRTATRVEQWIPRVLLSPCGLGALPRDERGALTVLARRRRRWRCYALWLVGWSAALVCTFVCAFVSAVVCLFRGLFACVLSWVEILDVTLSAGFSPLQAVQRPGGTRNKNLTIQYSGPCEPPPELRLPMRHGSWGHEIGMAGSGIRPHMAMGSHHSHL